MEFVYQPATNNRLGDFLLENFSKDWPIFRAAIAFVKKSGTKHIASALSDFAKTGSAKFVVGIDHKGTSKEGLQQLLDGVGANGHVVIFNNPSAFTFHPKIYLFRSDLKAEILIGSGNLTEGGIFTNYEASVLIKLDLALTIEKEFLKCIEDTLDDWSDLSKGSARLLDADFLSKLVARGDVPIEALASIGSEAAADFDDEITSASETPKPSEPLFKGHSVPKAPSVKGALQPASSANQSASKPSIATPAAGAPAATPAPNVSSALGNRGFLMVLQNTDVGKGQTTTGTSARSPEVFIPLKARDADPDFWGWPDLFDESPKHFNRPSVKMSFGGGQEIVLNIMCSKLKRDMRLRHESLRSGGKIGDILRLEKAPPNSDFDYLVEIVKIGTTMHSIYLGRCTETVPHSLKTFGYY